MKKKKNLFEKVLKIVWFVLGGIILLWTFFFYIWMRTSNDFGVFLATIFFGLGIYALLIFLVLTFLYCLIKWIIGKWK